MSLHPPIVRRFIPPTEDEVAASRARADELRRQRDEERQRTAPARRAAILSGPRLRDVDAAIECLCSCHPRPCDEDTHDGGTSCPCQRTQAEAESARRDFLARWTGLAATLGNADDHHRRQRDDEIAAAATALGVEAGVAVAACPFVIVGTCDGRGFYLRERHGEYRVTIAPDDDPGSDPWTAEPTATSIDIAAGHEHELIAEGRFSAVSALQVAVAAVRSALARQACGHTSHEGGDYCPACGVPLADADQWRWH